MFKTENELVEILKTNISSILSKDNFEILEEVGLGYGIADLLISYIRSPLRGDYKQEATLNRLDIATYHIINTYTKINIDKILEITRNRKTQQFKSLNKLLSLGFIMKENDKYIPGKQYSYSFKRNIAIEVKLKNWKQALRQAYRYKFFAEYTFVALDAHYSNSAIKNINEFKKYNVGLASISNDGKIVRHYNPSREKPYDPKMKMLLSEKIYHDFACVK
jgi:predicted transcriptional regulator